MFISTKYGVAPDCKIQFAEDRNVIGETITTSFFPHLKIFAMRFNADVPLDTATANFDLKKRKLSNIFQNMGAMMINPKDKMWGLQLHAGYLLSFTEFQMGGGLKAL